MPLGDRKRRAILESLASKTGSRSWAFDQAAEKLALELLVAHKGDGKKVYKIMERLVEQNLEMAYATYQQQNRMSSEKVAHRLDGVRGHKLMPSNVKSKIPKLYSQEDVKDPMAWVKFFSPYSSAVWYITEFDGSDTMFGYAQLFPGGGELGYISLREIGGSNRNGLPLVERDIYWKPRPLSKAKRS